MFSLLLKDLNFYYYFQFKCQGNQNWPHSKICQGKPRITIYTNFAILQTLILHTMFQGNWPSGSGEDFLRLWAFLSMAVILVMWLGPFIQNFVSFSLRLNMKFGFDWPSRFGEDVWNCWPRRPRRRPRQRRTPEHGYTISSPCEPNGSGELKLITSYLWEREAPL